MFKFCLQIMAKKLAFCNQMKFYLFLCEYEFLSKFGRNLQKIRHLMSLKNETKLAFKSKLTMLDFINY
ncbi:hypothetical protein VH98_06595 [Acinetobacter brisouii]|nr:hypothetical protein VH98_06595 [Acinetobacter brisouii]